jgi:hypothetical protein
MRSTEGMGTEDEGTLARQIERWLNEGGRDVDEATRKVLAQARSFRKASTSAQSTRSAHLDRD